MSVYCLGSINVDHVYAVPHLVGPGETLAADSLNTMLGGKGANQSIAAARAGADVHHVGAVGPDGGWTLDSLQGFGVKTADVARVEVPTGHAIITVDPDGENAIVLFLGANQQQSPDHIAQALDDAGPGDSLLIQNETSHQVFAAQLAQDRGLRVIYSAAPFSAQAVAQVLPYISLLVLNAVEAEQLAETGLRVPCDMIITRGADGVEYRPVSGETVTVPAFPVTPVDTTGAGDCFIGSVAGALDSGAGIERALRYGAAAAAIQVTRPGTSQAMPTRQEVLAFLG